ncbi:MAG: divalent-cation tolerance protein CutA [Acidobacteria bacterium]|nr:divalent-cation tolerance protein CutA [Acidobacteriota bacterium]
MLPSDMPLLVWSTWPDGPPPDEVVEGLLAEGLVACVSVGPLATSHYRWKGMVERARECGVLMKTVSTRLAALEARWLALHPYDVPEFLVSPVSGGSAAYLDWLRAETT